LNEQGRVIGFFVERITEFRHAAPGDLTLCRQAWLKLHGLDIKRGDINKHSILIHDGKPTVIVFDSSTRCCDVQDLDEEF